MCVSSSKADFAKTKGYVGESNFHGRLLHVLGYQNQSINLSDGPNSMILHFPTKESMGKDNIINVGEKGKTFLDYMCHLVQEDKRSRYRSKSAMISNSSEPVIFETGIYTVVMSNKPTLIEEALQLVPENKRPQINKELLEWYEKTFPNYSVAICCFDNKDVKQASPLFWWYEPMNPQELRFPAVDCHEGSVPNLKEKVAVDHVLTFSALNMEKGFCSGKKNFLNEDIQDYFPEKILGCDFSGSLPMENGDFVISTEELRRGTIDKIQRKI